MTPHIQYLLMMAQRFGNTPTGQAFQRRAEQAIDALRRFETRWPNLPRGAGGQFPARTDADKIAMAPISRGLAGATAAGSVTAGGPGTFDAVSSRLTGSPERSANIPPSLFEELNARSAGAPPMPPQIVAPTPMRAEDLDGPSAFRQPLPMMALMPQAMSAPTAPASQPVRRAVQVARSVMPSNPPLPPQRPREAAGEPTQLASAAPQSEGFFNRLFRSEPDTRSSREMYERATETGSPADFFQAERARREGRAEGGGIPEGMMGSRPMPMPSLDDLPPMPAPKPVGGGSGGAGGSSSAINKALEIIHHLVMRGR